MSDGLVSVTEAAGVAGSSFDTLVHLVDNAPTSHRLVSVTFAQLAAVKRDVERLELVTVRQARAAGMTWQQIGDLLGVTRQSAHLRFRHLV